MTTEGERAPNSDSGSGTNNGSTEKKGREQPHWISYLEGGCAVLLVVITGFYTYYAAGQLHKMKRSTEAAETAALAAKRSVEDSERFFATEHRPYVIAFDPVLVSKKQLTPGGTLKCRMTTKNIGKLPALDDRGMSLIRFIPITGSIVPELAWREILDRMFQEVENQANRAERDPTNPIPQTDVAPDQPPQQTFQELPRPLTVDESNRINRGKLLVFFFGLIRYNASGTKYETQFCWFYTGANAKEQLWQMCPIRNTIR